MGRRRKVDDAESPKVPINLQTLRESALLLRYVRPYWRKLCAALFCLSVGTLLGLGFPYLAGNLVDAALLRLENKVAHVWWQDVNFVAVPLIVILAFQAFFAFLRACWFIEVG